jgi:hypothetical protein
LTPLDFWLWGTVKNNVYARKPRDLDQLKQFIQDKIAAIRVKTLVNIKDGMNGCTNESKLGEAG